MGDSRRFDPLYAALSRNPRRLKLPISVFRWWLLGSAIIFIIFGMLMKEIFWSVFLISAFYSFLVLSVWEEDNGLTYKWEAMKRRFTVFSPIMKGVTYEPSAYGAHSTNRKLIFPTKNEEAKQHMEVERLPYFKHYSPNIIINRNGDLMTVIRIDGVSFAMKSYDELEIIKSFRAHVWNILGNRFVINTHYIRRKMSEVETPHADNQLAEQFLKDWYAQFNQDTYVTDIYITLTVRAQNPNLSPIARIKDLFKPKEGLQDELADMLNRGASSLIQHFNEFCPERLTLKKDTQGNMYCETSTFIGYLLNLTEKGKDKIPFYSNANIDNYIDFTRKIFKETGEIIYLRNDGKNKVACVMGIPTGKLPEGTDHQMIDKLLSLDSEFVVSQTFIPSDTDKSRKFATDKEYDLEQSRDRSISQLSSLSDAIDDIDAGRTVNGIYAMNILVIANTKTELLRNMEQIVSACSANRLHLRREDLIAEPSFFSMLPGNYALIQRPAIITNVNFAGLSSLHNNPLGKKDGNHWGTHVLQLPTEHKTPYFFNWHVNDVGHTRFIAATGGGKTTLLNALLTASMKFQPYIFHFDSGFSASVFINAVGGKHLVLSPTVSTNWNPLLLPDTESNRSFLNRWFAFLGTKYNSEGNSVPLSSKEENLIKDLVDKIYNLPIKYRKLSYIKDYLPIAEDGNLSERLEKWIGQGAFAKMFDNEEDNFSFEGAKCFGFEMKYIKDTPELMAAATMYIFHRINEFMVHCHPAILTFEEGQLFIKDKNNERFLDEALTTFRRRNGTCIFVTPSPSIINQYPVLREQFKTTILLPNKQAEFPAYCGDGNVEGGLFCTQHEFDWIKAVHEKGAFLVKQEGDCVACILNLKTSPDIEKYISIFSGDEVKYNQMNQLKETYGENVSDWLPHYMEAVGQKVKSSNLTT